LPDKINVLLCVSFQRTEFILDYRCICYGSFLYNKNYFCGKSFDISYTKARELQHNNSAVLGPVITLRCRDVLHAFVAWDWKSDITILT